MNRLVIIIGILLLTAGRVGAGDTQRGEKRIVRLSSDATRHNSISLTTQKSYNTYHWNGAVLFRNMFGPLYLDVTEQFSSSLIITDRKLITDQNSLNVQTRFRLSDMIAAAANVTSFTLSDSRSIGGSIGKASSHGLYGGIAWTPFDGLVVEPLIGTKFDNQLDRDDRGPSYLVGIELDTSVLAGYQTALSGFIQYDNIFPRTLETHRATLSVRKEFSEQATNNLHVGFYRNRRDFYLSADSSLRQIHDIVYNIESRSDNILIITDSLRYSIGHSMSWTLHGNIFSRNIDRSFRYKNISDPERSPLNTSIEELRIEGIIRNVYRVSDRISGTIAFSYLERDEKHMLAEDNIYLLNRFSANIRNEERKNNHVRRSNLAGTTTISLSSSDTIGISGSSSILCYDTPSQENDDDRDELWYVVNVSSRHSINKHLTFNVSANLALTHLVYLFSSRSADNNWNRIIQLSPTIVYTPSRSFRTRNTFEVLANYTIYDFEQHASMTRSYSFRQFTFIDSTSLRLSKRFGVGWFNHIRLYERGEFRWNNFSEKPVNYFEDKLYHGNLRYQLTDGLHFTVGIRYFSQLRFAYEGKRKYTESHLRCIGPTTTIHITAGKTNIFLDGWYERRSQTGQPVRSYTSMDLTLNVQL